MKPQSNIKFAILVLALASLACLETVISRSSITPATNLLVTPWASQEEPYSGAVYEIPIAAETNNCATVTAIRSLNLREKPSTKSRVITWLPADAEVRIVGKVGDWWKITTNGAATGYAYADYLKEQPCK